MISGLTARVPVQIYMRDEFHNCQFGRYLANPPKRIMLYSFCAMLYFEHCAMWPIIHPGRITYALERPISSTTYFFGKAFVGYVAAKFRLPTRSNIDCLDKIDECTSCTYVFGGTVKLKLSFHCKSVTRSTFGTSARHVNINDLPTGFRCTICVGRISKRGPI